MLALVYSTCVLRTGAFKNRANALYLQLPLHCYSVSFIIHNYVRHCSLYEVYLINTVFLKLSILSYPRHSLLLHYALRDIELEIMVASGIKSGSLSVIILGFQSYQLKDFASKRRKYFYLIIQKQSSTIKAGIKLSLRKLGSQKRSYVEVSGQVHAPATLTLEKELKFPCDYEAGWAPQPA